MVPAEFTSKNGVFDINAFTNRCDAATVDVPVAGRMETDKLPTDFGEFTFHSNHSKAGGKAHLALVHSDIKPSPYRKEFVGICDIRI